MTIVDTRKTVAGPMGLPESFDGSVGAYADLSQAQQIQMAEAVDTYINANPAQFTAGQVRQAQIRIQSPTFGQPIADSGFLASAAELPGALLDSAQLRVNEAAGTIQKAIWIAAAVGIVYVIYRYGPLPKTVVPVSPS